MGIIISLTAFPVIIALILLVTKGDKTRNGVMAFASIAMTAASIAAVVLYFPSGEKFFKFHFGFVNYVVIGIAAVIAPQKICGSLICFCSGGSPCCL